MSYQVLARKWRPKTFREMVGQEHVLKALINALDHGRLHHAYLFTGTRGVGKTTIARILAKSLNCETGISSAPCGQCSACQEINDGRFVDLIEVDAASRTKVEDTRELLENVQYAPTRGRYKVYLIDEVHMLSGHSFNALLKTLEEPPEHVKFLLATTDPQKLPITILSRCLQFSLKAMTPERIVGHLKNVLEAEMVECEEPALWQLGRAADGSMRDAMSLTDQAIAFGNGKVVEADVRAMLGSIDREYVFGLLEAMAQNDPPGLLQRVAALAEQGPDYAGVLADMIATIHRMTVAQLVPDAVDDSDGDRQRVLEYAQQFAAEDLQLFYQIALQGRKDLTLAPDARSGFEMTLLRMLLFKPQGLVPNQGAPQGGKQSSPVAAGLNSAAPAPIPNATAHDGHTQDAPPMQNVGKASDHLSAMKQALGGSSPGAAPKPQPQPKTQPQPEPPANPRPDPAVNGQSEASNEARSSATQGNQSEPSAAKSSAKPATAAPINPPANAPAKAAVSPPAAVPPASASAASASSPNGASAPNKAAQQTKPQTPAQKTKVVKLNDEWADLIGQLQLDGPVRNFARNASLEQKQGDTWQLAVSPRFEALYRDENRQLLEAVLAEHAGCPVQLKVDISEPTKPTPDQLLAKYNEKRKNEAVALMKEDPFVQDLQNLFGAKLDDNSVKAID